MHPDREAVFVEARARLHFGVLDLSGTLGRWFGGIGAAAPAPTLLVSASQADELDVNGEDADRAREFARRVLEYHELSGGVSLRIHRSLPAHVGLGSGTQLALATARAIGEIYGIPEDAGGLARAAGRGHRSAIGTYLFEGGGLVLEGGRRSEGGALAPLIARLRIPESWWCVVGVPQATPGVSGLAEREAFRRLPAPPARDAERVAHQVLMGLLPALIEADLAAFGEALRAIQSITGRWFASVQGGTFAPGPSGELVRAMTAWGVPGVGQSSWGPAVYGIVDGEAAGRRLDSRVRESLGEESKVYSGPFPAEGARLWRGTRDRSRESFRRIG